MLCFPFKIIVKILRFSSHPPELCNQIKIKDKRRKRKDFSAIEIEKSYLFSFLNSLFSGLIGLHRSVN